MLILYVHRNFCRVTAAKHQTLCVDRPRRTFISRLMISKQADDYLEFLHLQSLKNSHVPLNDNFLPESCFQIDQLGPSTNVGLCLLKISKTNLHAIKLSLACLSSRSLILQ